MTDQVVVPRVPSAPPYLVIQNTTVVSPAARGVDLMVYRRGGHLLLGQGQANLEEQSEKKVPLSKKQIITDIRHTTIHHNILAGKR